MIGQTVNANFHLTPVNTVIVFVSFYTPGKFKNNLVATAKSPTTLPAQINFVNQSQINFKTISLGYKRFIKGSAIAETSWNLYGYAGFGLLLAKAQNTFSIVPDSSKYNVPEHPVNGGGRFQRLTIDVAIGGEYPMGGDLYLYVEGRTWILTSDYPTKYLLENQNTPIVAMANVGLRILF